MKTIRTAPLSARKCTLARKSIAILRVVAAFAAFALPATHLMADVIPPLGLAPGSQYQLIFVTADARDATSSNIADYNAFVTAEAALNPSLPSGVTWHAIASTPSVTANLNAPSMAGVPVYNTHGDLVEPGGTSLYSGNILFPTGVPLVHPVGYDQNGNVRSSIVWTGAPRPFDGTANQNSLGNTFVVDGFTSYSWGESNLTGNNWLSQGSTDATFAGNAPLFALSTPVTVTPEPATLTLLVSGFLVIGGIRLLRWRRAPLAAKTTALTKPTLSIATAVGLALAPRRRSR